MLQLFVPKTQQKFYSQPTGTVIKLVEWLGIGFLSTNIVIRRVSVRVGFAELAVAGTHNRKEMWSFEFCCFETVYHYVALRLPSNL